MFFYYIYNKDTLLNNSNHFLITGMWNMPFYLFVL